MQMHKRQDPGQPVTDTSGGYFNYPTQNLTNTTLGTPMTISWSADWDVLSDLYVSSVNNNTVYTIIANGTEDSYFSSWPVSYPVDTVDFDSPVRFWVQRHDEPVPTDDPDGYFYSTSFYINQSPGISSTSSTASVSASTTMLNGNTITAATASPAVSASTTSAQDTGEPALSKGAKAGIGAGVAIGSAIVLLLAALLFLTLRKRKTQAPAEQSTPLNAMHSQPEPQYTQDRKEYPAVAPIWRPQDQAPVEADTRHPPQNPFELAATP